jgi:hypothetical protein
VGACKFVHEFSAHKTPGSELFPLCAASKSRHPGNMTVGRFFFIDHHSRQDYIGKNNTRLTLLIQL